MFAATGGGVMVAAVVDAAATAAGATCAPSVTERCIGVRSIEVSSRPSMKTILPASAAGIVGSWLLARSDLPANE